MANVPNWTELSQSRDFLSLSPIEQGKVLQSFIDDTKTEASQLEGYNPDEVDGQLGSFLADESSKIGEGFYTLERQMQDIDIAIEQKQQPVETPSIKDEIVDLSYAEGIYNAGRRFYGRTMQQLASLGEGAITSLPTKFMQGDIGIQSYLPSSKIFDITSDYIPQLKELDKVPQPIADAYKRATTPITDYLKDVALSGQAIVESAPMSTDAQQRKYLTTKLDESVFTSPKYWIENGTDVVSQLGTQLGLAYITKNPMAAFAIGGGAPMAAESYIDAKKSWLNEGLSEEEAASRAMTEAGAVGVISSLVDLFPASKLIPKATKDQIRSVIKNEIIKNGLESVSKNGLRNTLEAIAKKLGYEKLSQPLKGGIAEAVVEPMQEGIKDLGALFYRKENKFYDPNDPVASLLNTFERYIGSAVLGFGGGTAVSTVATVIDSRNKIADQVNQASGNTLPITSQVVADNAVEDTASLLINRAQNISDEILATALGPQELETVTDETSQVVEPDTTADLVQDFNIQQKEKPSETQTQVQPEAKVTEEVQPSGEQVITGEQVTEQQPILEGVSGVETRPEQPRVPATPEPMSEQTVVQGESALPQQPVAQGETVSPQPIQQTTQPEVTDASPEQVTDEGVLRTEAGQPTEQVELQGVGQGDARVGETTRAKTLRPEEVTARRDQINSLLVDQRGQPTELLRKVRDVARNVFSRFQINADPLSAVAEVTDVFANRAGFDINNPNAFSVQNITNALRDRYVRPVAAQRNVEVPLDTAPRRGRGSLYSGCYG